MRGEKKRLSMRTSSHGEFLNQLESHCLKVKRPSKGRFPNLGTT